MDNTLKFINQNKHNLINLLNNGFEIPHNPLRLIDPHHPYLIHRKDLENYISDFS